MVYQCYLVLHVLLGGMFMFRFLKDYRLQPVACLAGSVVFCFTGCMSLNIIHPNRVEVYAWLPLQLLMGGRFLATRHVKYFWYLVVVMLLSFLAGYPQVSLYGSFLTVGFWLFSWWLQQRETQESERADRFRQAAQEMLKVGAMLLCVLLLSAAAILPAVENWYYSSLAGREMGGSCAPVFTVPRIDRFGSSELLWESVFHRLDGCFHGKQTRPGSVVRFWGFVKEPYENIGWPVWQYQYSEMGAYAGQLSLLAIVVLLFNWKRLENRAMVGFFVVACGLAIWFMLGRHAGLFNVLFHILPGISLFRGPTKMRAVLDCAAAVLVAFFVNALTSGQKLKFGEQPGYLALAMSALCLGRWPSVVTCFPNLLRLAFAHIRWHKRASAPVSGWRASAPHTASRACRTAGVACCWQACLCWSRQTCSLPTAAFTVA